MPMPMQAPQAPTPDQAKQLFEQGFSDMAHNILLNRFPNLANDVVTFKLLSSDFTKGAGVGAFVMIRGGQSFYVPVVMADNQVKPLDLIYYKELNSFLPLTKEWLEELAKMSTQTMGQAARPPKSMPTDVDIRNIVVPPTTGRYSYAAEAAAVEDVFAQARIGGAPEVPGVFLDFVARAPNNVKTAAAVFFQKNPKLFDKLAGFNGFAKVRAAFAPHPTEEKVADYGAGLSHSGGLYVADPSTSGGDFKKIFGSESPIAYQGVRVKGYYARDSRKNLSRPITIQEYVDLQSTDAPGVYKLWCQHGQISRALVVPDAVDLTGHFYPEAASTNGVAPIGRERPVKQERTTRRNGMADYGVTVGHFGNRKSYVGITEKGKLIWSRSPLLGDVVPPGELAGSAIFKKVMGDFDGKPKAGQRGFWLLRRGQTYVATQPVYLQSVMDSDGLTRVTVRSFEHDPAWEVKHDSFAPKTVRNARPWDAREVIMAKSAAGRIMVPPLHDSPVQIPSDAIWIKVDGDDFLNEDDYLNDPKSIFAWAKEGVLASGATGFTIKKASSGNFVLHDRSREWPFTQALTKLALDANIPVDDAAHALKIAAETGRAEFYAVPQTGFRKLREYFDKTAAAQPPAPAQDPAAAGQDPAGAAMQGVPQAPPGPQMPSPVDMAVAEQMQSIQMQMQALQAQQQTLMTVQQRANMIAGYGGAIGAPAAAAAAMAPPMDPSQMGAGGMPAPQQPQQPGMPQQAGAPPQQPGMPQPGQQGEGQQPTPAMTADDGDPNTIAQQVSPQFMDQAAQMNDAGVFDAAALASMAQAPALKDLVGAYLPNLEKALDNVGRMLLTLWMDESRIKQDVGDETYIAVETNLRSVLRGLGDLLLKVHQTSAVLRGPNEQSLMV